MVASLPKEVRRILCAFPCSRVLNNRIGQICQPIEQEIGKRDGFCGLTFDVLRLIVESRKTKMGMGDGWQMQMEMEM